MEWLKDIFRGKCNYYDTGDYYHFITGCGGNYFFVPRGGKSLNQERCRICKRKISPVPRENREDYE